ncbi:DegT/DnrJ/EryC1/StrS family aminotransferase [Spirochaeta lutea]|uniref:DegT/DnrJ/EryC1/StrS aminotransferase n=1 Tax=Spirochaeta lutea TaxID=1480694 RepID=A0A098QTD6_9SPIO|nr:DegT/DnrJ/EryC1/StrS aminotransferase family protein [Spirochaeta lutea]KGE71140.1 hypothetical protein DC28_12895 [Spirochaeta lutea]
MAYKIPLAEPSLGQEELQAVQSVVQRNWLTMGPVTNEFEKMFAEKIGVKYAFSVSNCTAALHMACLSIGLGPGDEVLCPVLSFVATANAIEYTGAQAVFVNPKSVSDLTLDPEEIEKKITPNTKAIMVMHYGGYSVEMGKILSIANKYDLHIIEDCAHSILGKNSDGSYLGTKGNIACFSFYGNKNMTTGEGGMVVTNSDDYADTLKLLRSHGMTTLSFDRFKGHASEYEVRLLGYNYRLDDLRASIGIEQLKKVEGFNQRRQELVTRYFDQLINNSNIFIPFLERILSESACHLMVIIPKENPDGLREYLSSNGIQTSRHYKLISDFSYYKNHKFKLNEPLLNNIVTLPLYPTLRDEEVDYICSMINKFYDS